MFIEARLNVFIYLSTANARPFNEDKVRKSKTAVSLKKFYSKRILFGDK